VVKLPSEAPERLLRNKKFVQANPSGTGLVTRRRLSMSQKGRYGHPKSHLVLLKCGQLAFAFPVITRYPIDVPAWWAASPVGTRPPGPCIQLCRLEQCELSFLLKETTAPKWNH